jgi:hypothetical protein
MGLAGARTTDQHYIVSAFDGRAAMQLRLRSTTTTAALAGS